MYRTDLYLAIVVGLMFLSGVVLMIPLALKRRRIRRQWSRTPANQSESR
jgi:hypothetical protein